MFDTIWDSPEQEEAAQWVIGLLATVEGTGIGVAFIGERDGGWSVEAVSPAMPMGYVDFELPGTNLSEADDLHHAAAVAKRKLGRLLDSIEA